MFAQMKLFIGKIIMANKLDRYDTNKLKEARELINQVYGYNFKPSDSLSKKLETILKKIDNIIENDREK